MPRLLLAVAVVCLAGSAAAASPKEAPPPAKQPSVAAKEPGTLKVDVVGGRWRFSGRGVSFKEVARAIEAKVPVDIRIQDPALESIEIGMAFEALDSREGMRQLLDGFNYSEFADPKSGRQIYLVTSLASEVRGSVAAESRPPASTAWQESASSPKVAISAVKNLDEFRRVDPARIVSREQPQTEIDRDVQRERDQRLARAMDALASPDLSSNLHREALTDLAGSGDPRATAALRAAMNKVAALPGEAAPHVARSVWQHAAQLQFADPDANALLLSLGSSSHPKVREVAQAARQDMDRYRTAQNAPR